MQATTTQQAFACHAIIRTDASGNQTLEVTSPKTGKVLKILGGWFHELADSRRLLGRVSQAMGRGERTEFTKEELTALVAIHEKIVAHFNRPKLPRGAIRWSGRW